MNSKRQVFDVHGVDSQRYVLVPLRRLHDRQHAIIILHIINSTCIIQRFEKYRDEKCGHQQDPPAQWGLWSSRVLSDLRASCDFDIFHCYTVTTIGGNLVFLVIFDSLPDRAV